MGTRVVAVSDVKGTIFNKEGLNFKELLALKVKGKSVVEYKKGKRLPRERIYELKTDILIPAAISDVINERNVNKVKAKIIVEEQTFPLPKNLKRY